LPTPPPPAAGIAEKNAESEAAAAKDKIMADALLRMMGAQREFNTLKAQSQPTPAPAKPVEKESSSISKRFSGFFSKK